MLANAHLALQHSQALSLSLSLSLFLFLHPNPLLAFTRYLWLDIDSRWGVGKVADCDPTNYQQCQAYVMVELLPPTGNVPIPGYEKENCNMNKVHASEQGMPLIWKPPPPPPPSPPTLARAPRSNQFSIDGKSEDMRPQVHLENIKSQVKSEGQPPLPRPAAPAPPTPAPLAGKQVRARIYMRDATV